MTLYQTAPPAAPAPAATDLVIETRGLTKQFGDEFAVRDITFHVPRGKIFGFIGPSGSGKTTVVRLLTGIYNATAGEARVLGSDPGRFTQTTRQRIGYMPQLFVLYPDLTVWENLNFVASLYGMNFWTRRKRMNQLLDFVELSRHRGKVARTISGGMQRRLSLASTLVHDPEMIFLDEPTAGIDPVLRRKFWDHFRALHEQGRTLFITTQYVGEAAYCDYVGVMANGRLLMVETPEGLRRAAYGGEVVDMTLAEEVSFERHVTPMRQMPFVEQGRVYVNPERPRTIRLIVDEASTAMPLLIEWTRNHGVAMDAIEEFLPPFDDVFVELVKREPASD